VPPALGLKWGPLYGAYHLHYHYVTGMTRDSSYRHSVARAGRAFASSSPDPSSTRGEWPRDMVEETILRWQVIDYTWPSLAPSLVRD
jgi:hypothetical protein